MVLEPFRELVEFIIRELAILDNGVKTRLEPHFYRNHSWLFFKVFGLGFQVLKPDVFVPPRWTNAMPVRRTSRVELSISR
jgi:hypothetical protein